MKLIDDAGGVAAGDEGVADVGEHIEEHGVLDVFAALHQVLHIEEHQPVGSQVGVAAKELGVRSHTDGVKPQPYRPEQFRGVKGAFALLLGLLHQGVEVGEDGIVLRRQVGEIGVVIDPPFGVEPAQHDLDGIGLGIVEVFVAAEEIPQKGDVLGEQGTLPESGGGVRIGRFLSCAPGTGFQHIDPMVSAGEIQVGTAQPLHDLPIFPFRVQSHRPLAALQNIAEKELEEVAFALAAVTQDQHIGVGFIPVPAVQVGDDGTAVFVVTQVKAARVGLAGVGKREEIGHTGCRQHPLVLIPQSVVAAGHHRAEALLLAEVQPVHGDLRPAQLRLDAVPKLGKRLLAFGDEFDIYRRVEKRLPVALGGSDHGRHILQVALGFHHLPDIGAAGPEAVGLVRRLEDLPLLRRGNQPGVDPQGNAGPFPQPLEDGLFLGGRGVPPHRPDAAPGVAHEIAVGFKPHRCRRDEVQKGLKHLCLVHNTGGAVVAAAILHQPSLAVEVVVSLAHRIPGEVDGEDALEVLPVRPAHRKLLLPDHLFQPVQVGIYLFLVDAPGPNQEDKLPGSGGAALDLIQMAKILL